VRPLPTNSIRPLPQVEGAVGEAQESYGGAPPPVEG